MRVLIIHPTSNYNIGDLLTFRGTCVLLREIDPDMEILFFDIDRACRELYTYMLEFYWGQVDLVVLAGSPWIWFGMPYSMKGKILRLALKRFKGVPKIGLGIGSCFPIEFVNVEMIYREYEHIGESLELFKEFDLIVTRDILAQTMLESFDVQSFFSRDVSVYAAQTFDRQVESQRPLCIFYNPKFGISANAISSDYVESVVEIQNMMRMFMQLVLRTPILLIMNWVIKVDMLQI